MEHQKADVENSKTQYTFEEDLWDQLQAITLNYKKGNQFLSGFSHFCKNYNKVLQTFSYGLLKCAEQFEKDMLQNKTFDTTSIAITNIKQGMEDIAQQIQSKVDTVFNDLIEPLEQYQKNYIQTNSELISQSKTYWHTLEEEKRKLHLIQDRYYKLMTEVEQSEISIEVALLEHEKGILNLDQVQRITNQTLNVKYKTELASQDYKREVEYVNQQLSRFDSEYKPLLQKLQQNEESRINFLKYGFEKFLKHQTSIGSHLKDKSQDIQSSVSMINSETDLKIFIDEYKTYALFNDKVDYVPYEHSKDVQIQKAELIKAINDQKHQNNIEQIEKDLKDNELEESILLEYLNRLMRSTDLTFDEKSEVISSLHNPEIRDIVSEYLRGINSPKLIENHNALKTLGEILKYLLTAYVHEKDDNYKVIYSILHSSHQIYSIKDGEDNERQKIYLTQYLSDHGIWQEQHVWKQCIQKLINQKFHEAIQSPSVASAKQQQQVSTPSAASSSIFGQFNKLKGFLGQSSKDDQDNREERGKIRNMNENDRDYFAFRDKVINNSEIISNVEEVIIMDVQRSFTKTKQIDPVVLTNILKTYAFFNPEIEYCQGMNFVAGFLYLFFRDEVKAFKALQHIVHVNDMAELFDQELPKLKLFFYQFDRLLSILMPQVHSHFKDEYVNASYYCSAWFITIFTQSMQNQEGDEISEKLLQLWDYFLTCGWKAIFKMGLFVIKENDLELQRMNFEQILNLITERPKQLLSENVKIEINEPILYKQLSDKLQMHNLSFMLMNLEQEFKSSLEASNLPKKDNSNQIQASPPRKSSFLGKKQNSIREEEKIQEI
eukprot:403349944